MYVWRGTYSGQPADFIIKSNELSSLSIVKISNTVYQATLQGKVSYSINSQATGRQLYDKGNDTFISTVTDGDFGLSQSSSSADKFSVTTFESGNVKLHPINTISLIGGDIVVHH